MKLHDYLRPLSEEDREAFADRCGTTVGYLNQLKGGHRSPSLDLALALLTESNGAVGIDQWKKQGHKKGFKGGSQKVGKPAGSLGM